MRVMIVVPTFAKRDERHQQIVRGKVFGRKASRAPQVGDRVHHPGGMQPNYYAREYTPQQPGQSANREQDHAENYV